MFFQPSGSSKSSGKRTKRGPNKKLKEGVKYNIEAIRPSGKPLAPKKIADKFVRQCGVLVKDQLPISIQEWKEPKTKRPGVTWVDDRAKKDLVKSLMEHFTLPDHFTEAVVLKVKDAARRKMAVAFKNHKNREWDKYVKGGRKDSSIRGNTREAKCSLGRFREIQGFGII